MHAETMWTVHNTARSATITVGTVSCTTQNLFRGVPVAISFADQLRETRTAAFIDAIHHPGIGQENVTALRRDMTSIRRVLHELASTVCCCLRRCVTAFYGVPKCATEIQIYFTLLNRYGYRCDNARKAMRNHLGQLRL